MRKVTTEDCVKEVQKIKIRTQENDSDSSGFLPIPIAIFAVLAILYALFVY